MGSIWDASPYCQVHPDGTTYIQVVLPQVAYPAPGFVTQRVRLIPWVDYWDGQQWQFYKWGDRWVNKDVSSGPIDFSGGLLGSAWLGHWWTDEATGSLTDVVWVDVPTGWYWRIGQWVEWVGSGSDAWNVDQHRTQHYAGAYPTDVGTSAPWCLNG